MQPRGDTSSILNEVYEQLRSYTSIDLLSTIAASQLCPENADHIIRLEALSHAAVCLPFVANSSNISRHKLNRICNFAPLGDGYLRSIEDPCDNPFTEAFTFFGGSYIVFPGIIEDITFSLRHLTSTIFLRPTFAEHKNFMDKIHNLVLAILVLSNEIAKRANLGRNLEPISRSRDIYIPQSLQDKKKAILFTEDELLKLFLHHRLTLKDIEEFVQNLGDLNLNSYTQDTTPIHTKPIIRIENYLLVIEPGILLAALRFQILTEAKKADLIKLLSTEFQDSIAYTVATSLDLFGLKLVDDGVCERDEKLFLRDGLWTLDTDKALYVALITDDFSDFVGKTVFEEMPNRNKGELLDKYLLKVEETIFSNSQGLSEFFALIVFAGIGRMGAIASKLDGLKSNPAILSLSAEELEILSLLHIKNPLILYKFARDIEILRQTSPFVAFSALDIFEMYRKHDYSFYFTDKRGPYFINFSPGSERELRLEVLRKYDKHAVPYFRGGYIEAFRLYGSVEVPIYVPVNLYQRGEWFVELNPLSFWVIHNEIAQTDVVPNRVNPALFVDMITYWLWQFSIDFEESLGGIEFSKPLVIQVKINNHEDWQSIENERLLDLYPNAIDYELHAEKFAITLEIHPSIHELLHGATNVGELNCISDLLNKIAELMDLLDAEESSIELRQHIPAFFAKHVVNPLKKKLLAVRAGNVVQMMPGNYLSVREIQGSDQNHVLNKIGEFCVEELKIPEGEIPENKVVSVLNQVVDFCFSNLKEIVATLSPEHVLEFLVAQYEAIVTEKTSRQITLPTQLACFDNAEDVKRQLVEELPKLNKAATSCRFLIEYITTTPPTGTQPISYTIYDRLMALAAEIIDRGQESDYVNYRLFNLQLSILPSGRLGVNNQRIYTDFQTSFIMARSREELDDATQYFASWWHSPNRQDTNDSPTDTDKLNLAFSGEFGFSLKDLSRIISDMSEINGDLNDSRQMKKISKVELISSLIKTTNWDAKKIEVILDFLSLKPRGDFLTVPRPYSISDVFPWRLSRGLSYMRRPLLMVEDKDQKIICWGIRHLFDSFEYIFNSSMSGKLQPRYSSQEMQRWLGEKHKKDGAKFNAEVSKKAEILPNTVVQSQVKKFGSKRLGYPGNELGDIDVLIISPDIKTILLIECKNLLIARTPFEMKSELEELFVDGEKNISTLTKHKKRENWVKDNLEYVLSIYNLDVHRKWKINSLLVVRDELITPYFHKPSIPVVSYLRFVEDYLPSMSDKIRRKSKS